MVAQNKLVDLDFRVWHILCLALKLNVAVALYLNILSRLSYIDIWRLIHFKTFGALSLVGKAQKQRGRWSGFSIEKKSWRVPSSENVHVLKHKCWPIVIIWMHWCWQKMPLTGWIRSEYQGIEAMVKKNMYTAQCTLTLTLYRWRSQVQLCSKLAWI